MVAGYTLLVFKGVYAATASCLYCVMVVCRLKCGVKHKDITEGYSICMNALIGREIGTKNM